MKKLICMSPEHIDYVNEMSKKWFSGQRSFGKALKRIIEFHRKRMEEYDGR